MNRRIAVGRNEICSGYRTAWSFRIVHLKKAEAAEREKKPPEASAPSRRPGMGEAWRKASDRKERGLKSDYT